jgi:ribose transport system substrate-binding protein
MKTSIRLLSIALIATALLVGCNRNEPTGASQAPAAGPAERGRKSSVHAPAMKKWRLAFITNNAADFWTIARAGCTQAEADLGDIDMTFLIPGDATAATQQRYVDDLLAKGVDGIAISPVDPANQTLMLNNVAKQALLVTQDSDAPQSDRACYIGADNFAAGEQAGELIKKALPGGGKIMVFVGNLGAQNAKDRLGGIKKAIAGTKIEIIDARTDDTDLVRAKSNALDAIVKYPDVACLVGLWSYNGPAILNAVTESGKQGKIKIVCFDEDSATLQGVKDGVIFATVVQQPYEFGYRAMKIMEQRLRGDKSVIPENKTIIVPTQALDATNVDAFWARLKTLRGEKKN